MDNRWIFMVVGLIAVLGGCVETVAYRDDEPADESATGCSTKLFRDADGDGQGALFDAVVNCSSPAGYVEVAGDCNDKDESIHTAATEACNGRDDDCDGTLDDGLPALRLFADHDGDGHGAGLTVLAACAPPDGYAIDATDCDDVDASVFPDAVEACDGRDNDCNGAIDEGLLALSGDPIAVTTDHGAASQEVAAVAFPGGYLVAWVMTDGSIFERRFAASGEPMDPAPSRLRTAWSGTSANHLELVASPSGTSAVAVWYETAPLTSVVFGSPSKMVSAARIPLDGTAPSPRIRVDDQPLAGTPIFASSAGDRIVISWRTEANTNRARTLLPERSEMGEERDIAPGGTLVAIAATSSDAPAFLTAALLEPTAGDPSIFMDVDRAQTDPLAPDMRPARIGFGVAPVSAFAMAGTEDAAGTRVALGASTRSGTAVVWLAPGDDATGPAEISRTSLSLGLGATRGLSMHGAFGEVEVLARGTGASGRSELSWVSIASDGALSEPVTVARAYEIGAARFARAEARGGAIAYVAADETNRADVWLQRVSCE